MTAAINDVDDETLESLHAMCVNEVRKINGIIDYENAVRIFSKAKMVRNEYEPQNLNMKGLN